MNKRLSSVTTSKQKRQQELQQVRQTNADRIKAKIEKKKIDVDSICQKKDLHNILNSFLKGEIFDQDIFNEFWDFHFKQKIPLMEAMNAYNSAVILLLQKIIQYNLKIFQLNKEKDKHKQNHQYKLLSEVTIELQQTVFQLNQYIKDLEMFSKPFDFNFDQLISKYRPYKIKENGDAQYVENTQFNNKLQLEYEEEYVQKQGKEHQLQTEEKYYRFAVYLTTVVFVGDLAICFAKFNFFDLFVDTLLLFNGLFQQLMFKDDEFNNKVNFIQINYVQNKLYLNQVYYNPFQVKFYQIGKQAQQIPHNFTNYAYSSIFALIFMIFWDIGYLILINGHYMDSCQSGSSFVLGSAMWKYNRFVAYTSIFMLVLKIIILLLTYKTVSFDYRKVMTSYNFDLNFLRFTNITYINEIAKGKQQLNE